MNNNDLIKIAELLTKTALGSNMIGRLNAASDFYDRFPSVAASADRERLIGLYGRLKARGNWLSAEAWRGSRAAGELAAKNFAVNANLSGAVERKIHASLKASPRVLQDDIRRAMESEFSGGRRKGRRK